MDDSKKEPKAPQNQINIELSEDIAEGIYSNVVMIAHSPSEIIFDFARIMPGSQKGRVHARIIMTPPHAKMFFMALQDNLKKFEEQFGEIKTHGKHFKHTGQFNKAAGILSRFNQIIRQRQIQISDGIEFVDHHWGVAFVGIDPGTDGCATHV